MASNKKSITIITKVQAQLNHSKVVKTRMNEIRNLQDKIIKQSCTLKDGSITMELLEDKDKEIKSLILSMKNPYYNLTNLVEAFKKKEEQNKKLQEMDKAMTINDAKWK